MTRKYSPQAPNSASNCGHAPGLQLSNTGGTGRSIVVGFS